MLQELAIQHNNLIPSKEVIENGFFIGGGILGFKLVENIHGFRAAIPALILEATFAIGLPILIPDFPQEATKILEGALIGSAIKSVWQI